MRARRNAPAVPAAKDRIRLKEAISLGEIARTAEELDVLSMVATSPGQGNDVVEMQIDRGATPHTSATVASPHEELHIVGNRLTALAVLTRATDRLEVRDLLSEALQRLVILKMKGLDSENDFLVLGSSRRTFGDVESIAVQPNGLVISSQLASQFG